MSIINITKDNFEEEVMYSNIPVLIDFWAEWCGPCRRLSPIVDEIAKETSEVKVCKVNVDEEPFLAEQFKVSSIPMLVLIKDGKIYNTSLGVKPKESIKQMIMA